MRGGCVGKERGGEGKEVENVDEWFCWFGWLRMEEKGRGGRRVGRSRKRGGGGEEGLLI